MNTDLNGTKLEWLWANLRSVPFEGVKPSIPHPFDKLMAGGMHQPSP
ncbi:MAG: hypothetical protein O7C75_17870 [Verrucomicrobia bacterium]|nr:hypothetical protein [Verrucomicrobiota bacterium]